LGRGDAFHIGGTHIAGEIHGTSLMIQALFLYAPMIARRALKNCGATAKAPEERRFRGEDGTQLHHPAILKTDCKVLHTRLKNQNRSCMLILAQFMLR
ncbi:MAG: hypothetical protein IKF96_02390, partial [Eggerthellaceae bacterium]|nr:hypothetical protein [Eggerthellaceae bacterium]